MKHSIKSTLPLIYWVIRIKFTLLLAYSLHIVKIKNQTLIIIFKCLKRKKYEVKTTKMFKYKKYNSELLASNS